MKKLKFTGLFLAVVFSAGFCFADDFDFGDDFGSDFGGDFGGFESGAGSFSGGSMSVTGEAEVNFRAYFDDEDEFGLPVDEWKTESVPKGKINLSYSSSSVPAVSADAKFALSRDVLEDYREDVIDELTLEASLGNFIVQAGKMKVVWGKGDKLHVLDNFNANDYRDFIIPDYIDRRISEPMFRVIYNVPKDAGPFSSTRFEFVWTPAMTADRYAETGRWVPAQVAALKSELTSKAGIAIVGQGINAGTANAELASIMANSASTDEQKLAVKNNAVNAQSLYTAMLSNSSSLADNLYPDTKQLKYMQAGFRFTTTTGSFDWGLSYYAGRSKQASFDKSKIGSFVTSHLVNGSTSDDEKFIDYDFLQVFGLEAAKTFGAYNFRAEGAYNLTKDTAGDDPSVQNNSVGWLFGFDRDLPVSELNLNVQFQGKYILNHDKIDELGALDTESSTFENDNKVVVNISDSWNHGKLKPEVTAVYGFQHYDLIVIPKLTWYVSDGLEFSARGMYMASYKSDKTEFEGWHNNGFVQFGAKYTF
ncbi:hypothetical protein [Treponema berlinense]|uniref:hypothetical protein n=1 Tax=Treponema berlinense TaxID=225004 RepID=UPI0026EC5B1E|nr:hypothetical protein [Treponema berlinense]